MSDQGTQKKGQHDPEAIRRKLLADPNTKGIATNLGVTVEAYVEQVVHFAMNPDQEPSLYIVEDQDLKAMGVTPPDADAMGRYLLEAVEAKSRAGATSGFEAAGKEKVALDGATGAQPPATSSPELQGEVERARRSRGDGKA